MLESELRRQRDELPQYAPDVFPAEAEATRKERERINAEIAALKAELKALAEKEQVHHTRLALLVINEDRLGGNAGSGLHRVQTKLGTEAQLTVVLASELQVRASYAYRKGELKDKDIDQILADLPKILPNKD